MLENFIVVFLVVLALEFIVSMAWTPIYFKLGVPIFHKRIKVDGGVSFPQLAGETDRAKELLDDFWLSVKPISAQEVAVRERVFVISRSATLHGFIRYEPGCHEVSAWGFINWSLLIFIGGITLFLTDLQSSAWLVALALSVLIIFATAASKVRKLRAFVEAIVKRGPEQDAQRN